MLSHCRHPQVIQCIHVIALSAGLRAFEVEQVNKEIDYQTCTYIQSVPSKLITACNSWIQCSECGLTICVTPGMHTINLWESQELLKWENFAFGGEFWSSSSPVIVHKQLKTRRNDLYKQSSNSVRVVFTYTILYLSFAWRRRKKERKEEVEQNWDFPVKFLKLCLLVNPYYSYPNQRSWIYSKLVCLYLVTSVSRQIQVFVVIFQQRYYKITGYAS